MFIDPMMLSRPDLFPLQMLEDKLAAWHEAKFGSRIPQRRGATFAKLFEEAGEFAEAWNAAHDMARKGFSPDDLLPFRDHAAEELVDIIFVAFHLARALRVSLPDMILAKLRVIHDRLYSDKADAYKQVKVTAEQYQRENGISLIPIVGPIPGEAKSVVSKDVADPNRHHVEDPLSPTWGSHPLNKSTRYAAFLPAIAGVKVEEGSP